MSPARGSLVQNSGVSEGTALPSFLVDLTYSFKDTFPPNILERYQFAETRNAAAILDSTNPDAFSQIVRALSNFVLKTSDFITPGGQETELAARLNDSFRRQGWREARVDTRTRLTLVLEPYTPAGERRTTETETETHSKGYKVDNFKDRVALDVEWNAKDGNLDRDISAYRALYDNALIDVGVMVTRTQTDLRDLGFRLGRAHGFDEKRAKQILGTTTTTNSDKLIPRITRGDAGGCPFLGIFICAKTYDETA